MHTNFISGRKASAQIHKNNLSKRNISEKCTLEKINIDEQSVEDMYEML